MRLRTLLFIAFSGFAVFPVVALAVWIYLRAVDAEIENVRDTHLQIARNLGNALNRYARDVRTGFDVMTQLFATPGNEAVARRLMADLDFNHVCLVDAANGRIVDGTSRGSLSCPDTLQSEKLARFKVLATADVSAFSPVMAGVDGAPAIYLLRRLGDNLAIGELSTDYIVEQGKAISFGERGHAAIVDQTGSLLGHPLQEWRASMKNIAKLDPVQKMLARETGTITFFSPALEADMVAGFTFVPATGWGVMVPQPLSEIRAHAFSTQLVAGYITLGAIILAGLVSWYLSGVLTRPLHELTEASKRMSTGDLAARAEANSNGGATETVELAAAFNAMAAEISATNEELSKALDIAKRNEQEARYGHDAKSEFLSAMSQELRTPLNAVLGFAQQLQRSRANLTPEQADAVDLIVMSGDRLVKLVNEVLELAQIQTSRFELNLVEVSPGEVLDECLKTYRPIAEQRRISLHAGDLDGCPILVDPARFQQVLTTVLSNAIKYNKNGGSVRVSCSDQPQGRVWISVADSGRGIDKDLQAKLFTPFARTSSDTSHIEGSGIGLTIAEQLVRAMDGRIRFESELDIGTTVVLDFPAAVVAAPVN